MLYSSHTVGLFIISVFLARKLIFSYSIILVGLFKLEEVCVLSLLL